MNQKSKYIIISISIIFIISIIVGCILLSIHQQQDKNITEEKSINLNDMENIENVEIVGEDKKNISLKLQE